MTQRQAVGIFTSILFSIAMIVGFMEFTVSVHSNPSPHCVITPQTYSPPIYIAPYQQR
jgi:hypothetical protein